MDTSFKIAFGWIMLGFGSLFLGCSGDMSKSSEVESLRVLAIRSDPPEIRWPSDGQWAQASLSVLVAGGEEELDYQWGLCLVPGNLVEGDICFDESLYVSLSQDATAQLAIPSLDTILADNPEIAALPIDFEQGIDVRIQLSVDDGEKLIEAFKDVRVSEEDSLNQNPVLTGLLFDEHELEEGELLQLAVDQELVLEPLWSSDSIQSAGEEEAVEILMISWFSDFGEFKKERSTDTVPENTWTAPALEEGESEKEVQLWVVLRDDRGGVDWLSRSILLGGEE